MIAALWGKALPYLIAAGAVALAVGIVLLRVFGAGKTAARAEAAVTSLRRTREAAEARVAAMRPISPEEEARDPFNRDAR